MSAKALCTFGVNTHARLLEIALPSYQAFAKRHGYDLIIAEQIGHKRPAPWYKVKLLQQLLEDYELAVFIGADLVIVDGREDLPIPDDCWQAMVAHMTADGNVPNTDLWAARKPLLPWLQKVWDNDRWLNHGWWEQASLLEIMGYLPDIRPTYCRDPHNELYQHTAWLPNEWNVHIWDRPAPLHPRIQHATMWPDRALIMTDWALQAQEGWMSE